jgi:hypothetical protein
MNTLPGVTLPQAYGSRNLSSRQFAGTTQVSAARLQAHAGPQTGYMQMESPLPLSSGTGTSALAAAAWRHPAEVLPYSSATSTSTFQPFKAAQGDQAI